MARTVLDNKNVLILGVDCAPGRAAAQQFSRSGSKVVLASHDAAKLDDQIEQLIKKGGDPTLLLLSHDEAKWADQIRMARERMGHIHVVVNLLAFCHGGDKEQEAMENEAREFDRICAEHIVGHGPTKLITVWPKESALPPPVAEDVWQSMVVLGPRQRLDTQHIPDLDAAGTLHLRAGAVADSLVFLAQMPPSAKPAIVELQAIPSAEKKAGK